MHHIALNYWQGNKEKILKWLLPFHLNSSITSSDKNHKMYNSDYISGFKIPKQIKQPKLKWNQYSELSYLNGEFLFSTSPSVSQFITSQILWKHRQCLYFMYGCMINLKAIACHGRIINENNWQVFTWEVEQSQLNSSSRNVYFFTCTK